MKDCTVIFEYGKQFRYETQSSYRMTMLLHYTYVFGFNINGMENAHFRAMLIRKKCLLQMDEE